MNTRDSSEFGQISTSRLNKKHLFLLIAIFFLALFLRMHNLSERTFDHWDEGWYAASAGSAIVFADYVYSHWNEISKGHFDSAGLRKTVKENAPVWFGASGKPVLSVILLIGFILGGFNQFSLFFEMVIISLISMYIVYATAVRLFDKRVGLMAAFFFAVSGIIVFYSRTVMPQMIMVLFCMLTFYSSLRISEGKWATIFGLSSALAFFTHPATGIVLITIWSFVGFSLYKQSANNRKRTISRIVFGSVPSAIILFLIAELPQWLFKSQIHNPDNYVSNLVTRSVDQGISHGIFSSIDHISCLFMNIWESEFVSIAFVIFGIVILFCKCRKSPQLMIIIIPLCFILLYFFMGISYRFRIFVVIYPFLHILAGVGFISAYEFLSSQNWLPGYRSILRIISFIIIAAILLNGTALSLKSQNLNKKSFEAICSGLDHYLANLPEGEIRELSYCQGPLTWLFYYFSKDRIKEIYPHLTNAMIWDWARERPEKESFGDILIIVEGSALSDRIDKEKTMQLIGEREPIIKVPYNKGTRTNYLANPFKKKSSYLNVYDLAT